MQKGGANTKPITIANSQILILDKEANYQFCCLVFKKQMICFRQFGYTWGDLNG